MINSCSWPSQGIFDFWKKIKIKSAILGNIFDFSLALHTNDLSVARYPVLNIQKLAITTKYRQNFWGNLALPIPIRGPLAYVDSKSWHVSFCQLVENYWTCLHNIIYHEGHLNSKNRVNSWEGGHLLHT